LVGVYHSADFISFSNTHTQRRILELENRLKYSLLKRADSLFPQTFR